MTEHEPIKEGNRPHLRTEADLPPATRPEGATGGNEHAIGLQYPHTNLRQKSSRSDQISQQPDRYCTLPVVMLQSPDGTTRPAPFLMSRNDLAAFFRLHDSKTKFPEKTIQRYRRMGLRTVRIGRRLWFRLDDVLRFLDAQQYRIS